MRPWSIFLLIALAVLASGCADPVEQRSGGEVQSQLQRGVTGQGQLTERESERDPGDPAAEHGVPQTHP